jgi:pyridoxine 5-phosphate synthase
MPQKKNKIRLGVNIDHIATLRQVRGGTTKYPDLVEMAHLAVKSGADQITIHLREDRRHIQLRDLIELSKVKSIPLNLEMATTDEMLNLALRYKPAWVCLVPEKRQELTTEGGLNLESIYGKLEKMIPLLHKKKIKVSLFVGPQKKTIVLAQKLKADALEFHTGHWVLAKGKERKKLWTELFEGALLAKAAGMNVHAGHGLDFETAHEITTIPFIEEVNIGHSLISYSVEMGLAKAIQKMRRQLQNSKLKKRPA